MNRYWMVLVLAALLTGCASGWNQFAAEHNCRVVGQTSPSIVIQNPTTARGTMVVPGKTGYLCDDGVTYWR